MTSSQFNTPVVLTLFNFPDATRQVFAEIARLKPRQLFLIADAPRPNRPAEAALCRETLTIVEHVGWDCEVHRHYADHNLGARERLATGITWVFEQVETAIILEHDILPDPSLFPFCAELLERYRDDERVMTISGGSDLLYTDLTVPHSYYFTRHPFMWGWATWRRAWQHYDPNVEAWRDPAVRRAFLDSLALPGERRLWLWYLDGIVNQTVDSWDYQFVFTCLLRGGLTIQPVVNLVRHIGANPHALNLADPYSASNQLSAETIRFPLRHPDRAVVNEPLDHLAAKLRYSRHPRLEHEFRQAVMRLKRRLGIGRRLLPHSRRVRARKQTPG